MKVSKSSAFGLKLHKCIGMMIVVLLWVVGSGIVVWFYLKETQVIQSKIKNSISMVPDRDRARDRLVLSMTTIPARMAYIQGTLDSLLVKQTMAADRFYLALPHQSPDYVIPDFVQHHIDQGRITVLRPIRDNGAIDKLLNALVAEEGHLKLSMTTSNKTNTVSSSTTTNEYALQTMETAARSYRILYLDDDMIYPPNLIERLASKSEEYPDSCVAFSGTQLRSQFRQIAHSSPFSDRHPFLYYRLSGSNKDPPLPPGNKNGDLPVDIAQGFAGVLVRLSFFQSHGSVEQFIHKATTHFRNESQPVPDGVRRSDDFVISAHLARRGISIQMVSGGTPAQVNSRAAMTQNLHSNMNQNAMTAAHYLQTAWGVWKNYTFVDYLHLPLWIQDLIDCEKGLNNMCPPEFQGNDRARVTKRLDQLLNVSVAGGEENPT